MSTEQHKNINPANNNKNSENEKTSAELTQDECPIFCRQVFRALDSPRKKSVSVLGPLGGFQYLGFFHYYIRVPGVLEGLEGSGVGGPRGGSEFIWSPGCTIVSLRPGIFLTAVRGIMVAAEIK